ncbi:hypothetical protein ACN01J_05875 [Klebsiella pneumoniae]
MLGETLTDKCRERLHPAAEIAGAAFAVKCFSRLPFARAHGITVNRINEITIGERLPLAFWGEILNFRIYGVVRVDGLPFSVPRPCY